MKSATLVDLDGNRHPLRLPEPNAPVLLLDASPGCKCSAPVHVIGIRPLEISGHSTMEAEARCYQCNAKLGRLELEFSTIFGLEEDRITLAGRCRVYA